MKSRISNILTCLGTAAILCLQSSSAEAIFASVKSTSMAATCISYPIDSLVGAYNPAGMVDIGDRFDLEGAWVRDSGSARVTGNRFPGVDGHFNGMRTKDVYPAGFGVNKNFCVADDWEIGLGLILYNRNYQKTTYNEAFPLLGTTHLALEYLNETVSPILSFKWCDRHSFGISANYQLERVKVDGIQNFELRSVAPGHVTNRGYDYASGWGFTVGYRGQITDELSVGVTYQPKTSMRRMDKYKGFLAHRGKLDIPEKFGAGISYRIIPCVVAAFDVEHIRWSRVKALSNPITHDGVVEQLGSQHGPGFGFRNQWYYRVGAEWEMNEWLTFRAGYRYANTPIKRSQTTVNLLTLDTVESFLTVGGTWNVTQNNELSIVYAYGFSNKIKGKDSIPPVFGGGNVDLKEEKFALGLAWGYNY